MSGVVALVSLDGRPVPTDRGRAMLAAIEHRGDTPPRLWEGDGVLLGQAHRPTTPEAEREVLPGTNEHSRYWIAWDGRIDNRDELARLLDVDVTRARALTDAGYVLAAYERWGDDCVDRLLGDWTIVIWDAEARRLFCAKDPLGWRPLVFAVANGVFAAGSEPRQLFEAGIVRARPNDEYVRRYLANAVQEPGTLYFEGVTELQGGECLVVADGAVSTRRYWTHPEPHPRPYHDPREYVEEFAALFDVALRARLRTNRPVGLWLSGGLDSSYIAAIAARQGADVSAISSYVPDTDWDEREFQRAVVERTGLRQRAIDVSDCWVLSSRYVTDHRFDSVDHPPQSALMLRMAQAARDEGVGVLLSGEGGDDWMDGSPDFLVDALLSRHPRTAWRLAAAAQPGAFPPATLARAGYQALSPGVRRTLDRLRGHFAAPAFDPFVDPEPGWVGFADGYATPVWRPRRALRNRWAGYRQFNVPQMQWRDRHAFQPNGIEGRSPLNDLRLVELMASTPHWVQRFRGRFRDILREAEYSVLPSLIPDRRGKGAYNLALIRGLREERARIEAAVEAVARFPGVHGDAAREEVRQYVATEHAWWARPWRVISAGMWLHQLGRPAIRLSVDRTARVGAG